MIFKKRNKIIHIVAKFTFNKAILSRIYFKNES